MPIKIKAPLNRKEPPSISPGKNQKRTRMTPTTDQTICFVVMMTPFKSDPAGLPGSLSPYLGSNRGVKTWL